MLNYDYTEKLTGIKDINLLNIDFIDDYQLIEFSLKRKPHKCPRCNTVTDRIHDYRVQLVKDVASFGSKVMWKLHKRRYVCPACGKRFYESVPFLPRYQHTTNRLWFSIINELERTQSMKDIARRTGISSASVARILDHLAYSLTNLPEVLSIDEFKGNADGKKFQCILTNPKKKQVLDILPERNVEALSSYFSRFKNRNEVRYVVMDMSSVFRSMAESCFPKAKIVVDKFHMQRLVNWAFEDIRKTVQKQFHKDRRRYFKRSRWIMLKNQEDLLPDEVEQLSHMLELSKELAQAYYLMQEFRKVMRSKDAKEAKSQLKDWYMHVGTTDPEYFRRFHTCVSTFIDWQDCIMNAFESGLSNGFTEGCNNRIKVIKRTAYGLRNFNRFRTRILHSMSN